MTNRILVVLFFPILFNSVSFGIEKKINYELLGDYIQIWGLVKYHQTPEKTECLDMDSIFNYHISRLLNNPKKSEFDKVVSDLLVKYERIEIPDIPNSNQITSNNLAMTPDFTWIDESIYLSEKHSKLLKFLATDYLSDSSCFVFQSEDNSQANFINEYNVLKPYPNVETRILSLAKFWNMVFYFYAYKDLLSFNWQTILPYYIKSVIGASNSMEYHLAILELTILLEDSHVNTKSLVIDMFWGVYQLPINLTCYGNRAIVTSRMVDSEKNNPFKIGDQIVSISGKCFETEFQSVKHLIAGSNLSRKMYNYCSFFPRVKDTDIVKSKVVRLNDTIEIECHPMHIIDFREAPKEHYYQHPPSKLYSDSIGYIDPSQIFEDTVDHILSMLKDTKYLIIDLRKYPNLILDTLSFYFFEKPTTFSNWYSPIGDLPGYFVHRDPIKIGRENKDAYRGKVIIMVNAGSQSRAEFFAMALQKTGKNLTVGSQTSGADGNVTKINLPGSIFTSFTGLGITYPNGDQTQKKGVRVDLEFMPSGNFVKDYRDEEFEFLINQIQSGDIDKMLN